MKEALFSTKKALMLLLFFIVIAMIILFLNIYFTVKKYDSIIYPNIKIENVLVENLTKKEAYLLLNDEINKKILNKNIIIHINTEDYEISCNSLNFDFYISQAVNTAFSIGHNENLFEKYQMIKKPTAYTIDLFFTYDTEILNSKINSIAKNINIKEKDASIIRNDNGQFQITKEIIGYYLNENYIIDQIPSLIKNSYNSDSKNMIVNAKITEVTPKITSQALSTINSRISSHITNFSRSSPGRKTNIKIATEAINSTVIMPGDIFSFNKIVGQITEAKGYKKAKVIQNNRLVYDIGGGICQVSTTLFNAALKSNLSIIERSHHTLPSTYVPLGLDAAISSNYLDLKFKNDLEYPIYIEGYCSDSNVRFNIYSNKSLNKNSYGIETEVYEIIDNKTKYLNDSSLPIGMEKVQISGTKGYKVKVYLITYKNGTKTSKKLLYDDFYKPIDKIVKKGVYNKR